MSPRILTRAITSAAAVAITAASALTLAPPVSADSAAPQPAATDAAPAVVGPSFPTNSYVMAYQIRPNADVWVGWPSADGNGSEIATYEVWSSTSTEEPVATVPSPVTGTKIVGVPVGVPVTYTVTAVTTEGLRATIGPSIPVRVIVAPSAPREVTAVAGPESIRLSWLPPADTGGDYVRYVVTGTPGDFRYEVPSYTTEVFLNLTPGTTYTFSVAAVNSVGTSPAAAAAPATPTAWPEPAPTPTPTPTPTTAPVPTTSPVPTPVPAEPTPQAPARPDRPVAKVSAAKAVITWPAATAGAPATRYKVVLVGPKGKKSTIVVKTARAVLKNLTRGKYKVSVTAGNATGWSASSRVVGFKVR